MTWKQEKVGPFDKITSVWEKNLLEKPNLWWILSHIITSNLVSCEIIDENEDYFMYIIKTLKWYH